MLARPFLLSVLFIISGCVSEPLIPDADMLKTWQGKPKDELIATLGPPTGERLSETGTTILTWECGQRHPSGLGRMHEAESYYTVCVREFEIDGAGTLIRASQRGCHE